MQSKLFTKNAIENLLPHKGEVFLFDSFFSKKEADDFLQKLKSTIEWKQEPIKMFGKMIMQPRLTAWYGDADKTYTYSGITMKPNNWTKELLEIKTRIEAISNVQFTSALLNLYRDGQDSMGWHRDNEKELGENPTIGSVSFGESRIFKMREYATKENTCSIELTHGSFLLMQGETQHFWEHQIPKTTKKLNPRMNITFRKLQ
jgi:alkylated DNA repair dioxygenase AlkB